jgi:hypothetical protein
MAKPGRVRHWSGQPLLTAYLEDEDGKPVVIPAILENYMYMQSNFEFKTFNPDLDSLYFGAGKKDVEKSIQQSLMRIDLTLEDFEAIIKQVGFYLDLKGTLSYSRRFKILEDRFCEDEGKFLFTVESLRDRYKRVMRIFNDELRILKLDDSKLEVLIGRKYDKSKAEAVKGQIIAQWQFKQFFSRIESRQELKSLIVHLKA